MIKIRVPATSANIGSGFDSLGLAVNMYNEVWIDEADGIQISSIDGTWVPKNEKNLIYKTAKNLYKECGKHFSGLKILQKNDIPMTRGLGSSSACIVAGLIGANRLMGNPLSTDDIVNYAAGMEGHPDNSTPAILGGLVTAAIQDGKVYYLKQDINNDIAFAAFIPEFELSTHKARGCLPKMIKHKDGVFNLSRSALMAASLNSGKYENIKVACEDKLHQPYRMYLIKDSRKVFEAAYKQGAYGVYISGAGSTLMSIYNKNDEKYLSRIGEEFSIAGIVGYRIVGLDIDNIGATYSEEDYLGGE